MYGIHFVVWWWSYSCSKVLVLVLFLEVVASVLALVVDQGGVEEVVEVLVLWPLAEGRAWIWIRVHHLMFFRLILLCPFLHIRQVQCLSIPLDLDFASCVIRLLLLDQSRPLQALQSDLLALFSSHHNRLVQVNDVPSNCVF